jgi:hypothetical protein
MMLVVRGFTPVAIMAAVSLGVVASLVPGAFAAIVWMCCGGDAFAAFILGSVAVPTAVGGGAAWVACAGRHGQNEAIRTATVGLPETDRAARGGPEFGELDKKRACEVIDTPAAASAQ